MARLLAQTYLLSPAVTKLVLEQQKSLHCTEEHCGFNDFLFHMNNNTDLFHWNNTEMTVHVETLRGSKLQCIFVMTRHFGLLSASKLLVLQFTYTRQPDSQLLVFGM